MEERVHCLRERYCSWKVVHIGESLEVVYMEFRVHGSIGVRMVVALDMVYIVVGMVDMDWGHMEVNGEKGL